MVNRRIRNKSARTRSRKYTLRSLLEFLESRILMDGSITSPSVVVDQPLLNVPVINLPIAALQTGLSGTGPLIAPGFLTASAAASSIALHWSDLSNNENGFKIFRSDDGDSFTQIGAVARNKTDFTDTTTAAAGVNYSYRVSAFNASASADSNIASGGSAAASPNMPLAPTNLNVAGVSNNAISLAWNDNANNETGFFVYRSTDGMSYSWLASLPANTTSYTDSNLATGTKYYYAIGVYNSYGQDTSSTVSATNSAPAPIAPAVATVTLPATPTNLRTTSVSNNAVSLAWTDASNNETGFHVYRSTDGSSYSLMANLAPNATTFTDSTLATGTKYYYTVRAWNSLGEYYAPAISITTSSPPPSLATIPLTPSNLRTTAVSTNAVSLAWNDNANNETGFFIYRSTDGMSYSWLTSLPANSTSYTDSNLAANTKYYYAIGVYNSAGQDTSSVLGVTTASPTPAPVPAAPAPVVATGPQVSVTTVPMTSFNALRIDGTSGNDSILVTQSGSTLNVTANGQTTSYNGSYGNLIIHTGAGNDNVTVDSSVTIASLVYADSGSDTIRNLTRDKATIVTLGANGSNVTGNGINTAYWVNPGDTVNATSAEVNLGGVNRVSGFYQPWTTNSASPDYVPLSLNGQNLRDPSDATNTKRLTANSFWGTGATMNDINQTVISNCYFLAPLSSLAYSEPARLMNMGVDLGDGTYAIRFVRNGVTTFVRVDGDLATGGFNYGLNYSTPGANGNLWGSIFEKAYAFFRTGGNSYSSLNYGFQNAAMFDLGIPSSSIQATSGDTNVLNIISSSLAAGHAVVSNTNYTVANAPVIAQHVYSIINAYRNSAGTVMIQLRNPWGIDGIGNDGANDGLVTLTYAQFAANFGPINYSAL